MLQHAHLLLGLQQGLLLLLLALLLLCGFRGLQGLLLRCCLLALSKLGCLLGTPGGILLGNLAISMTHPATPSKVTQLVLVLKFIMMIKL